VAAALWAVAVFTGSIHGGWLGLDGPRRTAVVALCVVSGGATRGPAAVFFLLPLRWRSVTARS